MYNNYVYHVAENGVKDIIHVRFHLHLKFRFIYFFYFIPCLNAYLFDKKLLLLLVLFIGNYNCS